MKFLLGTLDMYLGADWLDKHNDPDQIARLPEFQMPIFLWIELLALLIEVIYLGRNFITV
jgi:hypothetical protein